MPKLLNLENLKEFQMKPDIVLDDIPVLKLEVYEGHVMCRDFEISLHKIGTPTSIV